MTLGAQLDSQLGHGRTGRERVAARALDGALDVIGVDVSFHRCLNLLATRPDWGREEGAGARPYEPGVGALAISARNSSLLLVVRILSISSSRPFPSSSAFSTRRSFQTCWSWFRSNSSSSWRVLDASTSMEG